MKHSKYHYSPEILLTILFSGVVMAEPVSFDIKTIESLGLNREEAEIAIKQAHKPYGKINTGIYLNGQYIGVREVDFDIDGNACLSDKLLHDIRFKPDLIVKIPGTDCLNSKKLSLISFQYEQTKNALTINIPDFYLEKESQFHNIQSGGFGTFLNYNANVSRSTAAHSQTDNLNAQFGWGANFNNVLLRTSFSYAQYMPSWGKSYHQKNLNSAWLETDLADTFRFRGGYLSAGNSLFGAGQINGFTLDNNVGMHNGDSTVSVSGIASGYSQVEVYQQGKIIFSRPVPAGPFLFDAVALHTAYSDAEVVIREESGSEQRYTIPQAAFSVSSQMASRFALFAGQTDSSRAMNSIPVLGAEYRLPFYGYLQPFTGALLTEHYTGLGAGLYTNLIPYSVKGDMNFSLSRSGKAGDIGQKFSTNLSGEWGKATPYLSLRWQSYNYRDLDAGYQARNPDYPHVLYNPRYSISGGVSKPFGSIGSGISFSRYASWNMPAMNSVSLFSSYSSGSYMLSANVSYGWQQGRERQNQWSGMLNLRIPFKTGGKSGSFSSYINHYQKNIVSGISASQTISDNLSAAVGIDRYSGSNNNTRHYAQAFWQTPYVNTAAYYSASNQHSRSYSTNLSGSVVTTGKNTVFSPVPVQDTFAVINTGVKGYTSLTTPTSRVITNYDGLAIAPQLFEARSNSVDIVTKTLPDGAYVKNPHQEITIRRGAVGKVDFSSQQERMYLFRLINAKNHFPYGTKVLSENADLLGYTIDEDILMLSEEKASQLEKSIGRISLSSGTTCYIRKESFSSELTDQLIDLPVTCGEKNE